MRSGGLGKSSLRAPQGRGNPEGLCGNEARQGVTFADFRSV